MKDKISAVLRKTLNSGWLRGLTDDERFLKIFYRIDVGRKLDLESPKLFGEKLQWLKLHDRKNIYTKMVDKCEVKRLVSKKIGKEYIIPTIGVYDSFDIIDFDRLPNRFVIKCTHDSGGVVVVKDKASFDKNKARRKINKSMRRNFYYTNREWPYKDVKPRIIVEQYMEDESGYQLKDYKIFCFDGVPKLIMVDSDRFSGHKRNVYDVSWNKMNMCINFPNCEEEFKKPKCLNRLLKLSGTLSEGMPFIRTDFYIINDRIYFGELTFYPGSGFQIIKPEEWDKKLGSWIDLSSVKEHSKLNKNGKSCNE